MSSRRAPLPARVLVVDDHADLAETLADELASRGYDASFTSSPERAAELLRGATPPDLLVTDLRMPALGGMDLLSLSLSLAPRRPVLVMTAFGAIDSAVECIRRGAAHYLTKPFKVDELALFVARSLEGLALAREAEELRHELHDRRAFGGLVTTSPAMRETCDVLARVADATVPVLLTGETGTGKSVLARALHEESRRRAKPFVTVTPAALPEHLLESELFGHARGAFTGALEAREGLVSVAAGGTLFLDEIGDMPHSTQVKLLDLLERGVVRKVGENHERAVDVRIVAATHRDLVSELASGRFREDLFYRLQGVAVHVPPLRQRRADIPLLAAHFLARARAENPSLSAERLAPETMKLLVEAPWPGNVRELRLAVERAALLARRAEIGVEDLPPSAPRPRAAELADEIVPMREMQRRYAESVLERLGGKKSLACEKLEIDPKTLNRLLG